MAQKTAQVTYHTKINAIAIIFQAMVVCTENLRHFCLWLTHSLIAALLLLKNVPEVFVGCFFQLSGQLEGQKMIKLHRLLSAQALCSYFSCISSENVSFNQFKPLGLM